MDQFSETKPELWENTSIKFFYLIWKIEHPITSVIFRGLLRSKNVQLFNKNRFCSVFPDRTSDFFSVLNVIRMLPSCCPGNNQWRTDTAAFAAQLTLTDRPGSGRLLKAAAMLPWRRSNSKRQQTRTWREPRSVAQLYPTDCWNTNWVLYSPVATFWKCFPAAAPSAWPCYTGTYSNSSSFIISVFYSIALSPPCGVNRFSQVGWPFFFFSLSLVFFLF